MSAWMRKLHTKEVFMSGLLYTGVALVLRQVEMAFTMSYYKNPELSGLWSKLMMPENGPPPLAFFAQSLLFTFATGVTLAAIFEFMKPLFGKSFWAKVIGFTDIVVGLMIVFGFFPMYLLLNIPLGLIIWWFFTGWVTVLLSAMIFAKRMK